MVEAIRQTGSKSNNETSKFIFSTLGAILVAIVSVGIILFIRSDLVRLIILPPIAYLISLLISFIFQSSVCSATNMSTAAITNIMILLSTGFISFFLYLESLPVLGFMGYSNPIDPMTGQALNKELNPEVYFKATEDEKHLKIQFLSGIVKAVLPVYFSELHKTSLVYVYWLFWMTLLPLYMALGVQGVC
jgi:hypothetical protein